MSRCGSHCEYNGCAFPQDCNAKRASSRSPGCSTAGDDIISTVFKYIDRKNDHCEQDHAEKILDEFTKEIEPALSQYIADGSR